MSALEGAYKPRVIQISNVGMAEVATRFTRLKTCRVLSGNLGRLRPGKSEKTHLGLAGLGGATMVTTP